MYARLFLALPLVLTVACGGGDDDDDDDVAPDAEVISPSCMEAEDHSDLAWLQENVFTPSCAAFTACHRGTATQAAGLNLEDGNTQTNLVGRVASSMGVETLDLTVVAPGDSANSYLMVLIDHESRGGRLSGPLPEAGTMPFNNPLMCVQKRDAIQRWIDSL